MPGRLCLPHTWPTKFIFCHCQTQGLQEGHARETFNNWLQVRLLDEQMAHAAKGGHEEHCIAGHIEHLHACRNSFTLPVLRSLSHAFYRHYMYRVDWLLRHRPYGAPAYIQARLRIVRLRQLELWQCQQRCVMLPAVQRHACTATNRPVENSAVERLTVWEMQTCKLWKAAAMLARAICWELCASCVNMRR